MNKGIVSQIIGVVVDVNFPDKLPEIYSDGTGKNGNKSTDHRHKTPGNECDSPIFFVICQRTGNVPLLKEEGVFFYQ